MQVDNAAAADLHGRDGLRLDPAAHHVRGDVFDAEHFGENHLGTERRITEVGDALCVSLCVEPHYSRLFHVDDL